MQTQAEAAKSAGDGQGGRGRASESRRIGKRCSNALPQRGGKDGITINKLMPYTGMRRSAVERHLAALFAFEER